MRAAPGDMYVAGFLARCDELRRPGHQRVDQPGMHGLLSLDGTQPTRLVIDDDRAYVALLPILACASAEATLKVFQTASQCLGLLDSDPMWRGRPATAMIERDLAGLPGHPLPVGMTTRPVRRVRSDPAGSVPLEDAAALAVRADPPGGEDAAGSLARYLRSLSSSLRLFAAVDDAGVVRATSGVGVFGTDAHVLFVNTDLGWRGRGVATAMTGLALLDARHRGAVTAHLDASADGLHLYKRLGFETAARLTQFTR